MTSPATDLGEANAPSETVIMALKRLWQPLSLLGAVLCIVSWYMHKYSLRLPSDSLGAIGLVLSAWGLLISIAGFGLTIWQLDKTQSATNAATAAVRGLKSRLATYDAIIEAQRALSYLQETQRHLRVPAWPNMVASCGNMRVSLMKLDELPSSLNDSDKDALRLMLGDITGMTSKIERGLLKEAVSLDRGRALTSLSEYEHQLVKITVFLQREIA